MPGPLHRSPASLPRIPKYSLRPHPVHSPVHSTAFLQALSLPELARLVLVADDASAEGRIFAEKVLEREETYRFERDDEIADLEVTVSIQGRDIERADEDIAQLDERIRTLQQELTEEREEVARLNGVLRIYRDNGGTQI